MKFFVYAFVILFLFTFSSVAQTVVKSEHVLQVEVANGLTLDLKASDLAKFPRREVKATGHDEKESVYSGYSLSDILLAAKAKIGKDELRGKEISSYLLVEAADGYKATFAIAEIAPEFTDRIILLADMRDGKTLDAKEGTWQIVVPGEKKYARWVRQVIKISVNSAVSNIGSTAKNSQLNESDSIRLIVIKKIVEEFNAHNNLKTKAYCISVNRQKDPSESLMNALPQFKIPTKKISDCFYDPTNGTVLFGDGILISTSDLDWKSENEVKIAAGSIIGNMGSEFCLYTLKKENGTWKIVAVENCIVS